MKVTVAVLVFPKAELLDFAGPLETLSVAGMIDDGACFTVGSQREVQTRPSGLRIVPDYLLGDGPVPDVVVVPGGRGASDEHPHTDSIVKYVRDAARRGALIASVCTGTFVLARAGLLSGRHCTTHAEYRERLQAAAPDAIVERATVVADGPKLVSAANVSSGIDLSLYLLERFYGSEIATQAATELNFVRRPSDILEFA